MKQPFLFKGDLGGSNLTYATLDKGFRLLLGNAHPTFNFVQVLMAIAALNF
jgi:hypothetical protein